MKIYETIAQKLAAGWNALVAGSRELAVSFAPVPEPIPVMVRQGRPQPRSNPRVINVLAYMDTRPSNRS
jgi:hypothetical protein